MHKVRGRPNPPWTEVILHLNENIRYEKLLTQVLDRNNTKSLDLSQPFRLSGLSSGAKLQLVVLSKSASVVSVALQLPESEGGAPGRLTDKFPSTTTLWLLLRKFESSTGSSNITRNFTARALPQVDGGGSGPGRLLYETPVINVMGREFVLFTDLQKTLAQLGFNSGSVLLRLSFRVTQTPLEEAMLEIDQYFKSVEGKGTGGVHAADVGRAESAPESSEPTLDEEVIEKFSSPEPATPSKSGSRSPEFAAAPASLHNGTTDPDPTSPSDSTTTGPAQRPIAVFAPPSTSTPAAARQTYNERDYEPTIDHAKLHQSRLAQLGRNRTLPSDAELAAQAEARTKKQADIKSVRIKIRFSDQSTVIAEFSNLETNEHLYEHVKGLLENEEEPFSLNFSTAKGPQTVPKRGNVRLITGLGMAGNVLVNVIWEEGASSGARAGRILKEKYREEAAEIEVKETEGVEVEEKENTTAKGRGAEKREGEKKGGVPKWLKLPGKR